MATQRPNEGAALPESLWQQTGKTPPDESLESEAEAADERKGGMSEKLEDVAQEYLELTRAMQSGVKMLMERDASETSPTHLRVGINSSLRDCASLAKLLLKKGIISELEYYTAIRDGMREEVELYEKKLSDIFGTGIHLG